MVVQNDEKGTRHQHENQQHQPEEEKSSQQEWPRAYDAAAAPEKPCRLRPPNNRSSSDQATGRSTPREAGGEKPEATKAALSSGSSGSSTPVPPVEQPPGSGSRAPSPGRRQRPMVIPPQPILQQHGGPVADAAPVNAKPAEGAPTNAEVEDRKNAAFASARMTMPTPREDNLISNGWRPVLTPGTNTSAAGQQLSVPERKSAENFEDNGGEAVKQVELGLLMQTNDGRPHAKEESSVPKKPSAGSDVVVDSSTITKNSNSQEGDGAGWSGGGVGAAEKKTLATTTPSPPLIGELAAVLTAPRPAKQGAAAAPEVEKKRRREKAMTGHHGATTGLLEIDEVIGSLFPGSGLVAQLETCHGHPRERISKTTPGGRNLLVSLPHPAAGKLTAQSILEPFIRKGRERQKMGGWK